MKYFQGLRFLSGQHVAKCSIWIERSFPAYYALNFAASGVLRIGGGRKKPVVLSPPVAWWTERHPTNKQRYGCEAGEHWDQYYVTFDGPRAAKMFREGLVPGLPNWRVVTDGVAFEQQFMRLLDLMEAGPLHHGEAVHLLEGMFLILQARPEARNNPRLEKIDRLAEDIRKQPGKAWELKEMAERLAMSAVHLRREFRKRHGVAPKEFLLQARMQQASLMLRTTDMPIKEIAEAQGVPDVYHFTKLFSSRFGLPPGAYRRAQSDLS